VNAIAGAWDSNASHEKKTDSTAEPMHPPLYRPHPKCAALVDALVECHDANVYGKFWGACNDQKAAMDACFKAEKDEKRRENLRKARAFDEARARRQAERAAAAAED
jgi:hypothetical protein